MTTIEAHEKTVLGEIIIRPPDLAPLPKQALISLPSLVSCKGMVDFDKLTGLLKKLPDAKEVDIRYLHYQQLLFHGHSGCERFGQYDESPLISPPDRLTVGILEIDHLILYEDHMRTLWRRMDETDWVNWIIPSVYWPTTPRDETVKAWQAKGAQTFLFSNLPLEKFSQVV